jgi:hypothetical protein
MENRVMQAESIKITALVIDEVLGTQLVLNKC